MHIEIVYDSSSGTTAKAARAMGTALDASGHSSRVQFVKQADPVEVAQADLLCIGSWVKGLFIIGQHPTEGTMQFIQRLPDLSGKRALVFCTYKLAAGSTLKQMARGLEGKSATVVGRFKYRGPDPDDRFQAFVSSLN